ncbi:MAG: hypothetical protein K6F61_07900 [Clostridiales bacterium]|nr:hypothetical protein [Clostridiales bacterium]
MNKTVKYILIGIGTSIALFAVILLLRMFIRGVPFTEGLKDWTNWLIAVCCAVSVGVSSWKKDREKEEKEKKENE